MRALFLKLSADSAMSDNRSMIDSSPHSVDYNGAGILDFSLSNRTNLLLLLIFRSSLVSTT